MPARSRTDIPCNAPRGTGSAAPGRVRFMINYTDQVHLLMADVVSRGQVLVFARLGRTSAHGAFATCHSLMVPHSEPAYYYWRDGRTGALTRRSEWFVTRSPEVRIGTRRISHLISIALPRFCDQTLKDTHKEHVYERGKEWLAKLDTIVHELYHVDPHEGGIRKSVRDDGRPSAMTHTPQFFRDVQRIVREYVASRPEPSAYQFLSMDFEELQRRHGGVTGTTFRDYPAFPQRYRERLAEQPRAPRVAQIVPLPKRLHRRLYTEADLSTRQFLPGSARRYRGQIQKSGISS
jgi:hypothetical protein